MAFLTFYTSIVRKPFAAITFGPLVFIKPEYKNDKGLLAHEQVHVSQWKRNPLMPLIYKFNKTYRLNCEVEAFKEQLKYYDNKEYHLDYFSNFLATNYNLNITKDAAKVLLST